MGSNYEAVIDGGDACGRCGRSDPPRRLHIGKASAGWKFLFHTVRVGDGTPEQVTEDLDNSQAWHRFLSRPDVTIEREYGEHPDLDVFFSMVERKQEDDFPQGDYLDREKDDVMMHVDPWGYRFCAADFS